MKTIIMAGGIGSRIQSVNADIPKPLIPINNKPILQYEIECLVSQGFTDIILTVSHKAEMIEGYFGDGSNFDASITYFTETKPLGNAGALFKLWELGILKESEDFLLLNADSMFDVDFNRFLDFHRTHNALVSLFTHPNSHPYDSGLIITANDGSGRVNQWLTKEDKRPEFYKNRVNAGLHILNSGIFKRYADSIDPAVIGTENFEGKIVKVDLDRQVLKPLAGTGLLYAYDSPEYVKDMGTPDRLHAVVNDFETGKVKSRNLTNKQKAIFLDRDGTINKYVGFLRSADDFELMPGVSEAIKTINDSGYLAIVVTNQPVVARGEVTEAELNNIHNKMETLLGEHGTYIDALYYCPHHPDKGFAGEVPELKVECDCRKPKPGMLLKAAEDYNIDLNASWMIGDGENDIRAGINAGTHTVLLSEEEADCGQDKTAASLYEAVQMIINNNS